MDNPQAALKAAAYAIVAKQGYNEAIRALRRLIGDLEDDQWSKR